MLKPGCGKSVERYRSALSNAGKTVLLTCTAGRCEITNSGESIDNIFQEAHKARARGRLQGEGRICLSTRSRATRSIRLRDKKWSDRILHAKRKNRIKLIHSPVVRLDGRDDKIRDTWVRMIDEKGNTILATEFVPVAKRLGLMTYIDRWVIAASMTYCTKRKPDLVFVRLSRNSMLDVSLAQWLEKIFRESTVKPEKICFQTTESVAARHMKQIIRQIDNIANLGVRFAIEQVGATPDTMKVLQFVPMQYARIDAALLQRVAWDKAVRHQVSKLVRATKARGVQVVADRIEDAATMAALCKMELDFMQGDYVRRDFITLEDTMTVCRPMLRSA